MTMLAYLKFLPFVLYFLIPVGLSGQVIENSDDNCRDSLNFSIYRSYSDQELDNLVNEYYNSLDLKDTFDLFGIIDRFELGDYFDQINFDSIIQNTNWNILAKEIDWNEAMGDMDWNEMLEVICDSNDTLFQNSPIDIDISNDTSTASINTFAANNSMNCFNVGNEISNMMEAMDMICLMQKMTEQLSDSLQDQSMNDLINVMQGGKSVDQTQGLKAFCGIKDCINANILFQKLDWNCMMKNFDFNQILKHWKINDLISEMDTVKVNQSSQAIQSRFDKHPMAHLFQADKITDSFKSAFKDFYDPKNTKKLHQNFYDNIFDAHWNPQSSSELKNVLELVTPLWSQLFDESKVSLYLINSFWLFHDLQIEFSELKFKDGLRKSLLLKDVLVYLIESNKLDDINGEFTTREILNKNALEMMLVSNLQFVGTAYSALGRHSLALEQFELAISLHEHNLSNINPKRIQETYLDPIYSDQEKKSLLKKFGIDTTVLQNSLFELNNSYHPRLIERHLENNDYKSALLCYKLFKELLLDLSKNNKVTPSYQLPLKSAERGFSYAYFKMIYQRMASILQDYNLQESPEFNIYNSASFKLDQYHQYQAMVFLQINIGTYYYETNNFDYALDHLLKAWEQFKIIKNANYAILSRLGHETIKEAYLNSNPSIVGIVGSIGQIMATQKNYVSALQFITESINFLSKSHDISITESDLLDIYLLKSVLHLYLNESDKSIFYLNKCSSLSKHSKFELQKINSNIFFGQFYYLNHKLDSANYYLQKAEKLAIDFNSLNQLSRIYLALGRTNRHKGLFAIANNYLNKSEEIAKSRSQYGTLNQVHVERGKLHLSKGDQNQALFHFDKGIKILEDSIFQFSMGMDSRQLNIENSFAAYEGAIISSIALEDDSKAFTYLQQLKSRTLKDQLVSSALQGSDVPIELKNELADVMTELNIGQKQLTAHPDSLTLFSKLNEFLRQKKIIETKIEANSEILSQLGSNQNVTINDIQANLKPNQAFLEYFSGEEIFVFVITASEAKRYNLGKSKLINANINQLVFTIDTLQYKIDNSFRNQNILQNTIDHIGQALYTQLLAPFIQNLDYEGIKELIVSPDQELYFIPFELLTSPEKVNNDLLSKFTFSYAQSATIHNTLRADSPENYPKDLLVIHKSNFEEYPRLPNLGKMNDNMFSNSSGKVDYLVDENANLSQLQSTNLKDYRQVYISTHGEINSTPDLSYLALSGGQLSLYNIFDLQMQNEIVILSACKTAKGKFLRGGGVMGFTRALMLSGTKSVILSLWSVSDAATDEFFKVYFHQISSGSSPKMALHKAKLEFKNSSKYSHPFYWAPFVLFE